MKVEITGEHLPVLTMTLGSKEVLYTENDVTTISLMSPDIVKQTISTAKRLNPFFSKLIFGDAKVLDQLTSKKDTSVIAFSAPLPGQIVALKLTKKKPMVIKKGSLLVMTKGITLTPRKKFNLWDALFGNDDLALQVLTGEGTAYIVIDQDAKTFTLEKNKAMSFDEAAVAYMDASMTLFVKRTNIFKAFFFGGNDVIKYKVTGPGKIVIQNANYQRL
jgi:uncharacterized protein (AIM24 family)